MRDLNVANLETLVCWTGFKLVLQHRGYLAGSVVRTYANDESGHRSRGAVACELLTVEQMLLAADQRGQV